MKLLGNGLRCKKNIGFLLFNIFSEDIIKSLESETTGIKVNPALINNIRYADDTIIIADSLEDLEGIINK